MISNSSSSICYNNSDENSKSKCNSSISVSDNQSHFDSTLKRKMDVSHVKGKIKSTYNNDNDMKDTSEKYSQKASRNDIVYIDLCT